MILVAVVGRFIGNLRWITALLLSLPQLVLVLRRKRIWTLFTLG